MSDKQRPRRPKAIVTRRLPEAVETRMAELFDVELNLDDKPFHHARPQSAVARADVLLAPPTAQYHAKLIGQPRPQSHPVDKFRSGARRYRQAWFRACKITWSPNNENK